MTAGAVANCAVCPRREKLPGEFGLVVEFPDDKIT
jgi:hypothetical protein